MTIATPNPMPRREREAVRRRLAYPLHRYTGLVIGLLLVISGLSGSVLVFRDEIEALVYPELLVTEARGERVAVDAVLQQVRRAYPDARPFAIRMPRQPEQTYLVKLNGAHDLFVYVDPYRGNILGAQRQAETVTGWIALLHTRLLSGEAGETALGIGGLLLVGLSVTGVILWWPRNGKVKRSFQIQWSAHFKRLNFDLHRVSGVYAALFLLITASTGAALAFNKTTTGLINTVTASPPRATPPRVVVRRTGTPAPPLDALLREADRTLPAETTWITLPQTAQAPVVIRKKAAQESHPNGRNFVYLDPYTGRVLQVEKAAAAPLGTRISNALYPVHVGAIAGTPGRLVQFAVGVVPALLWLTGLVMWRNRTQARRGAGGGLSG